MNDFSDIPTQVDSMAAIRAREDYEYQRLVAFHIYAWETWDRHQAMAKPWTNFSDSFEDGYDTARMPVVPERGGWVSRLRSLFTEVLA